MLLHQVLDEANGDRAAAARRVGVGRTTMYRWIKAGLLDQPIDAIQARYKSRPPVPTKLGQYTALIEARLAEFPRLSSTRLLAECRAAGYTGGVTQLRTYVQRLRPAPTDDVVRFETAPGQQAQIDWAHCRLPWGVRYALVIVLGYSRLLWLQFYPRQDLATLLLGLEACFTAWGGTVRDLLFDQMRSVLTRDDRLTGGGLVHNLELLRFARHWGCRVKVCRPYRAQTKGKVERPIRYLRDSFLYGRTFVSDADLNAQGLDWLASVANARQHATTKWIPAEQFAHVERDRLLPMPSHPYHSLVRPVSPPPRESSRPSSQATLPRVVVERRELSAYAALAAGGEP
jgi:transposase